MILFLYKLKRNGIPNAYNGFLCHIHKYGRFASIEILKLTFSIKEKTKCSHKAGEDQAQLSLTGLGVPFHYRECISGIMPQMSSSWHSESFLFFSCNYHNDGHKACPGWSSVFPLGWVPLHLHVMEDYAPRWIEIDLATEAIWQLTKTPNHLTLVYLEVSLSDFTNKTQRPEEVKVRTRNQGKHRN